MIRYQAKVYRDGETYSVEFPDLPGCFSSGKNKQDALSHAREALSLYLEEARDPRWDVPRAKSRKGNQYHWITPYADVAIPLMIRQARLKHSLSQNKLAKLLNITVQQLQKLEMPRKSNPTVRTLAEISRVLNEQLSISLVA
jgi:antitoxin HicB